MSETTAAGAQASTPGSVRLHIDGRVATLELDRPAKLNALTPEMLDELARHLEEVEATASVDLVLVRGAGHRVFCVGADIGRFADLGPVEMWRAWTALGYAAFERLARLRQPVIAVLHGDAFGGGLELALAADFRVVAEHARLGMPETGLGTVPGWGGTERLVDLVGRTRAKEVVLARRFLDAATAMEWGLANRVVPAADLASAVEDLAGQLLGGAPVAVQIAKQLIDAAADGAPSRVLEPLAGGLAAATADLTEGVAAFRARRSPNFEGR
ncbi:MAG: enoyl-CoA hydratase [Candidatus Nephthysia bennettiae]|uniref:Enoyl-CoA hydratase/isomerase family protein n=1 Tax=Candidatus Nephthysia bennettiae TaxID=3127016 RepID=A0A934K1V7_9BACT|nr:enoyl-CoA hydratase/isomerase family protein [Candidatus Dormibacteraeota bacterium]MBJ7614485.1 enoyl-CoA hydratase/isomerase family protein [Candidatus Dormibacteraeota bacterium]PZR93297.1 MAG: enoyl-CoA hydratase [Candidatus Dormibacteraeota bacterium]